MSTRHSRGITRKAAEQLLGGTAQPGHDPDLARLLAAAAAPGHEAELGGEATAVTAFETHHLGSVAIPRRGPMIKSPLAKLLTAKALAAILAVGVTGGAAFAASTAFTGSSSSGRLQGGAGQSTSAQPAPSAARSAATTGPVRLCRRLAYLAAGATSGGPALGQAGLEQALASPALTENLTGSAFSSLIATTHGSSGVPDYCALLLGLPKLPQPGDLSGLPTPLLSQLLPQLPAGTLAEMLASLPAPALSQVLSGLPASALSRVLTTLPASGLSQVLTTLPASTQSTLLGELPASVVSRLVAELPASVVSGLPTSVLSHLPVG